MRFQSHGKEHCHWASGSQLEDEVTSITSETSHPTHHILRNTAFRTGSWLVYIVLHFGSQFR